ncbi:MAG TPA: hypothetical protein VI193_11325 [Acidimicrobiia bacterium]
MPPELSDEHVAAICRVLIDHDVQFVIIGGMAARLHDTGHATVDVDICPSTDDANLERLASALVELGARLRVSGDPDGVPFQPHADMLRQVELMTLITEHGPLDLCFTPDGFPDGFTTLSEHASVVELAAVDVPVASLEDVVASKRAAGRPKDIVALPPLEARLRRR